MPIISLDNVVSIVSMMLALPPNYGYGFGFEEAKEESANNNGTRNTTMWYVKKAMSFEKKIQSIEIENDVSPT